MKILFIVPYPTEGASNRVRVEAYLSRLKQDGVEYVVRPFASSLFYKILYQNGRYALKTLFFIASIINRFLDIFRAMSCDMVFVHREACPIGPACLEKIFHKMGKPIIFDFDDAIYLPVHSERNPIIERFKNPGKIKDIIAMSRCVIAGNKYLADYARQFNKNVVIIPTSIEMDHSRVPVSDKRENKKIVIGWIGSTSTEKFLDLLTDVFMELNKKYPDRIEYHFIGAQDKDPRLDNAVNIEWSLEKEISLLSQCDIGLMPMPDNEWTRGKCAYKALLYMSMSTPVVASPVGVTTEIIKDAHNGFLASTPREWVDKISLLVEGAALRKRIGLEGRKTVEESYSIEANYSRFLGVIKELHE